MGKRVTTTKLEEKLPDPPVDQAAPIDAEELPPTEENVQAQDDLDAFMRTGAPDTIVKIYKIDPTKGEAFVGQGAPGETSEELIQENWGEGRYIIRLVGPDWKWRRQRRILIGPPPKSPAPAASQAMPAAAAAAPTTIDQAITMQIDMIKAQIAADKEILLELVRNRQPAAGTSFTELAAAMSELKKVVTPPNHEIFGLVNQIVPLVKSLIELGANSGGEKSGMGIVKEILSEVPEVLRNLRPAQPLVPAAAAPAAPLRIVHPAPAAGAVTEGQPAEASPLPAIDERAIAQLRWGIGFLKSRARARQDPVQWVETVLNTLDCEQSHAVAQLLDRPWVDIAKLDPEIDSAMYRGWFEVFFSELKNALSERNDTAGPGGDAGEPGADAGPGDGGVPLGPDDPTKIA